MAQKQIPTKDSHRATSPRPARGIPTKVNDGNRTDDERLTKDHAHDDENLNESVPERRPQS